MILLGSMQAGELVECPRVVRDYNNCRACSKVLPSLFSLPPLKKVGARFRSRKSKRRQGKKSKGETPVAPT